MNAYTGARTEPSDGAAAYQGSIGYMVIIDNNGCPVGYTVTAMGRNTSEFLSLNTAPTDGNCIPRPTTTLGAG